MRKRYWKLQFLEMEDFPKKSVKPLGKVGKSIQKTFKGLI